MPQAATVAAISGNYKKIRPIIGCTLYRQICAKFSRRIIFAVYVDSSRTAKIKLLETFRLNFPGVRGIVWKRYSTFAVLRGRPKHMEKFCVGLEIVLTRCKLLMSLTPAHIKQTCELKKLTPVSSHIATHCCKQQLSLNLTWLNSL